MSALDPALLREQEIRSRAHRIALLAEAIATGHVHPADPRDASAQRWSAKYLAESAAILAALLAAPSNGAPA